MQYPSKGQFVHTYYVGVTLISWRPVLIPRIQAPRGGQLISRHYFHLTQGVPSSLPSIDITEMTCYQDNLSGIGPSQPNDVVVGGETKARSSSDISRFSHMVQITPMRPRLRRSLRGPPMTRRSCLLEVPVVQPSPLQG